VKRLIHNGVIVPKYEPRGFHIGSRGRRIDLTPLQEEMVLAWVKKLGTDYVKDPVFIQNFFKDFSKAMDLEETRGPEDFDFSEIMQFVEAEKAKKLAMTREERKRLAQERKAQREANKEKYGYAIVDEQRVELGNYTVEPACVFMGRGKHPLRGRWKRGIKESEITLNLSEGAPIPLGDWKQTWESNRMWIARWNDPLSGKKKYIWFSDSSFIKQKREIEKFDKARELEGDLKKIRDHIDKNLSDSDPLRRKIATVWYLIDHLKFRVGDEKDEDEADTVGATTLRPEHVQFLNNGNVVFHFLGKDSVEWNIETQLPAKVVANLREFIRSANSSVFSGVNSSNAKSFLEEVAKGFTPKVFRTYHATKVVSDSLSRSEVKRDDPLYVKKYEATMANLGAAKECNHKRTLPKNWEQSLVRMDERLRILQAQQETSRTSKQREKRQERVKELQMRIRLRKETRDYNLNTSLKSYIDPRVYYRWGQKVGFDWRNYYSKTLQKKFTWVEERQ